MGATTIEYLVYLARLVLENYYFEFDEIKDLPSKIGDSHRDQVRTMFCEYIYGSLGRKHFWIRVS